jgi:hypothetical protein
MDYMDVRRRKVPCLSISSGSRSEGVTRQTPFAQPRVSPKITRAATFLPLLFFKRPYISRRIELLARTPLAFL